MGHRFLDGFIREIAPLVAMNAHPDDHRIKPGFDAWALTGGLRRIALDPLQTFRVGEKSGILQ